MTNNADMKAAFGEAVPLASSATVRVLSGGDDAALGIVLDSQGHVVTKASRLFGELACEIGDEEHAATLVGVDKDHDLAVLKIDAGDLTPAAWRAGDVPAPGSFVAAVGPGKKLLGLGVVSAEPRKIRSLGEPVIRRGWLGISLGGGDDGMAILRVMEDTPAEKAGLKPGDRVMQVNDTAVTTVEQAVQRISGTPAGQKLTLLVDRDGEQLQIEPTLAKPQTLKAPQDNWGGGPFSARRWGFPTALPHDVVIHPDDCGGPLIDTDGKVVGINIARALRVTTYAIPADVVRQVAGKLIGEG